MISIVAYSYYIPITEIILKLLKLFYPGQGMKLKKKLSAINLFWQSKNIFACNFLFCLIIQIFLGAPVPVLACHLALGKLPFHALPSSHKMYMYAIRK